MTAPWARRAVLLVALGSVSAAVGSAAQSCRPGVRLTSVELNGLTTASPGRIGRVEQLRLPLTTWRDSMWVVVTIQNDGAAAVEAVTVWMDARSVLGVPRAGPLQANRPDTGAAPPGAQVIAASAYTQHASSGRLDPGRSTLVTLPFQLSRLFPWFADSIPDQVAVQGVKVTVFALASGEADTACPDDPRDNLAVFSLPFSVPY